MCVFRPTAGTSAGHGGGCGWSLAGAHPPQVAGPCFRPGPFVEGDVLKQMIQVSVRLTPRACDYSRAKRSSYFWAF